MGTLASHFRGGWRGVTKDKIQVDSYHDPISSFETASFEIVFLLYYLAY